jgi:hypothetical protein
VNYKIWHNLVSNVEMNLSKIIVDVVDIDLWPRIYSGVTYSNPSCEVDVSLHFVVFCTQLIRKASGTVLLVYDL